MSLTVHQTTVPGGLARGTWGRAGGGSGRIGERIPPRPGIEVIKEVRPTFVRFGHEAVEPVKVRVVLGPDGVPLSAEPFSGDPALWRKVRKAALRWRFRVPPDTPPSALAVTVIFNPVEKQEG